MAKMEKDFGGGFVTTRPLKWTVVISLIIGLTLSIVGTTLAFFFANDYASSYTQMSGKVDVVAVTADDDATTINSIEDTATTSALVISLDKNYKYLIPGMPLSMPVAVHVFKSNTSPLLRARLTFEYLNRTPEMVSVITDLNSQMSTSIANNGWLYYEEDGCYYYVADNTVKNPKGNTLLREIVVRNADQEIGFITNAIKFPESVTSDLSGAGIRVVITFEAIQDFIPNNQGIRLDNTIANSKIIFDDTRNSDSPGIYVDGVKREFELTPGVQFSEAIASSGTTYNETNSCGWFADRDCTIPISPNAVVTEDMQVYTKPATPEKLQITGTTLNKVNADAKGEVVIPANITTIGQSAFGSNVTNVIIPNSVTTIQYLATHYSSIIHLHIPASVVSIDSYVGSSGTIEKITVDKNNTRYMSSGNSLIDKQTKTLVLGCKNSIIPTDASVVTAIGTNAFRLNRKIASLHIPANISEIPASAFIGVSSLANVSIDVTNPTYTLNKNCLIRKSDKTGIVGFKGFQIPDDGSITKISSYFSCDNESDLILSLPKSLTTMYSLSFYTKNIQSITISDENENYYVENNCLVRRYRSMLVASAAVTNLYVPEGVLECNAYANNVSNDTIKNIILPSTVTTLANNYCSYWGTADVKSSIFIPKSVTSVGKIFNSCSNITIYLESSSVPSSWTADWNVDASNTVFPYKTGYSLEQYKAAVGIS